MKQQEGQYATFEVSHESKVDNSLAKVCKKVKGVRTRAQSKGVAFARSIPVQMQMGILLVGK